MKHLTMKFLLSILVISFIAACNSSSSKDDDEELSFQEYDIGIPLSNMPLPANTLAQYVIPVDSGIQRRLTDLTLDLESTLQSFTFNRAAPKGNRFAQIPVTANLRARVSSDANTVCYEGEEYGPYIITIDDNDEIASVSPKTAEASKPTLNVINNGFYAICFQVTVPEPFTFSGSKYQVAFENCQIEPMDIGGYWSGTYSCQNTGSAEDCYSVEDEPIEILITQDQDNMYNASYGDYEAVYRGIVCGNTFEFDGGYDGYYDIDLHQYVGGYSEDGVMTFQDENNATKVSDFSGVEGYDCSGHCSDTLTRGRLKFGAR